MVYNITKENIIKDYAKVAEWIAGDIEAAGDEKHKEPISRIRLFGKQEPMELCRMILQENFKLAKGFVNDFRPFLDAVIELRPTVFGNCCGYFDLYDVEYDCREGSLLEMYPKYIEKIDFQMKDDDTKEFGWFQSGHWNYFLQLDLSILPFAVKNGYKPSRSMAHSFIENGIKKHLNKIEDFNYELYSLFAPKLHNYDAACIMEDYSEGVDILKKLLNLDDKFIFIPVQDVTAFKDRENNLFAVKDGALESNYAITKFKISESKIRSSFSDKDREVITAYLNLIEE